jgi:DNA-3-methyladenine glycosylase II
MSRLDLRRGLAELALADADFARVVELYGPPPPRVRPAGFATLMQAILAQQVSRASADAIWGRLAAAIDPFTPEGVLALDDAALRRLGLSQQKARYARALAAEIAEGRLDLRRLGRAADEDAIAMLTAVPGIGRWTAEIYLLAALQRPDVWPATDLALMIAVERLKGLPARPGPKQMIVLGEAWRPWRAVAARLLWHYYRMTRGREGAI